MSPIESHPIKPKPKPKPKRNRVPVSCLSCKKRKVKCDKGKPSCGGCIRNGVGHLCQYIDPPWLDSSCSKISLNCPQQQQLHHQNSPETPILIEQTEEYKSLKHNNENIIRIQRKEIEDLKRQLSVIQQLTPKDSLLSSSTNTAANLSSSSFPSAIACKTITILTKLNPLPYNKDKLEIVDEFFMSTSSNPTSKQSTYIDTYSWINLIKIDPQLTTLWFKITNLQKIYHTYKMNIIKDNDNVCKSNATKKNFKINEIDFTYSFNSQTTPSPNQTPQPQQSQQQGNRCPVIECDFNFMVEEALSNSSSSPFKNITSTTPKLKVEEADEKASTPSYTSSSLVLRAKLVKLFEVVSNMTRGQKLNYKQITFLLDYYFHSNFESKKILLFYRNEIQSVIRRENEEIQVDLPEGEKTEEEANLIEMKTKSVYISMLAIIVEETLDYLRNLIKNEEEDNTSYISEQFKSYFPNEVMYLNLGSKQTNIVYMVQDILVNFIHELNQVSFIAIIVSLLNKEIDEYKKPNSSVIDTRSSFTILFKKFLQMLVDKNSIEVWKDPELIEFKESCKIKKRTKHLRLQFCALWSDIIRLTNLVTINVVPLIEHDENLDKLLKRLYHRIQISNSLQCHLKYLTSIGENQLIVSLHIHYLIASVSCSLCHGIKNLGFPTLTVDNLQNLIKQCQTWSNDVGVQRLNEIRKIEVTAILNYLKYFMTYILMLQGEESMDFDLLQSVIPDVFIKLMQFIDYLKVNNGLSIEIDQSQYIYLVITELLTRSIQFIIGLLLRLKDSSNNSIKEMSRNITTEYGSVEDLMDKISQQIVQEISILEKVLVNKTKLIKLSKLWKFYSTFIQNSKQMNYAKLHAGVIDFDNQQQQQQQNKCPVLSSEATTSVSSPLSIRKDFSKCPISQITTPMEEDEIKPPIKKAKKCPFDHTIMMKHGNHPHPFNPIESNIRQGYKTHSPSPLSMSSVQTPAQQQQQSSHHHQHQQTPIPMQNAQPPIPPISASSMSSQPPQQNFPMSNTNTMSNDLEPIEFDILNQFNDFDLNFLNNESILEHFNVENSNSMSVEGFFQ